MKSLKLIILGTICLNSTLLAEPDYREVTRQSYDATVEEDQANTGNLQLEVKEPSELNMTLFALTHPTASVSRGIENLVICGDQSNLLVKGICGLTARIVSVVVFPIFLSFELTLKIIPEMLMAIGTKKFQKKSDKALKCLLSIIPSICLGFYSPEGVPGFFLKRQKTNREIRPFGVEKLFGKTIEGGIDYPKTSNAVQRIVKEARQKKQQVSVIGAGMSQGIQTVPKTTHQRVIHTKYLNKVEVDADANTVTVGSGATWEQVQLALDKVNKSVIVKQATDFFSIGGSIGINCHGWAHKYGSISKTVRSLKIVDANGESRTLMSPRPGVLVENLTEEETLFRCMFGTLGYFGVILEATLDIVDNEELVEVTEEVDRDQFTERYEQIKEKEISLFRGRLVLDALDGDPLRKVCMVSYQKREGQKALPDRRIAEEPKWGTRSQRIGLKLISHLPNFFVKRLISSFWEQEKTAMFAGRVVTRNEALHPPINAFKILHQSDIHAQWLQEYFIEKDRLANFLRFLGAELKANDVRLINATIRPTPKDEISILPYAEQDRHAVVISFAQKKTKGEIARTRKWIENVNAYLASEGGIFYQAYMPYATVDQFETCYGPERIEEMRRLKNHFDPHQVFGNAHTAKYYDRQGE